MRNADSKRQPVVAFLLLDGRTDTRVHHNANRAVERIQEKANIFNQPDHLALLSRRRFLFL